MDAAGSDAMLFVDGVSSIASIDFQQDAWGVDLAVSGSQKGFMMPPGLALLSVSGKALDAHAALGHVDTDGGMNPCYFSFADMAASNDTGYFPHTPPTPLLHGLRASLGFRHDPKRLRFVCFLTDGYIGNEVDIHHHPARCGRFDGLNFRGQIAAIRRHHFGQTVGFCKCLFHAWMLTSTHRCRYRNTLSQADVPSIRLQHSPR
jgi:hypothetical protein